MVLTMRCSRTIFHRFAVPKLPQSLALGRYGMSDIITTIVTSAVVASIVGPVVGEALRLRRERPLERLDALATAVALEGYALNCADKVADHVTAVDSGGHAGSALTKVPELPDIKVVSAFLKLRRAHIAHQLASLPQEVKQADQAADFWCEVVGDMDSARNEAVTQTASVGLRALQLAQNLRETFKLPPRKLVFGEYDVQETLKRHGSNAPQ